MQKCIIITFDWSFVTLPHNRFWFEGKRAMRFCKKRSLTLDSLPNHWSVEFELWSKCCLSFYLSLELKRTAMNESNSFAKTKRNSVNSLIWMKNDLGTWWCSETHLIKDLLWKLEDLLLKVCLSYWVPF